MVREIDCGELDMRIAADGSWWYRGSRIDRPSLVKLFASVLRREADGSYWLVTPAERGRITVDDLPFVIVEMQVAGEGRDRSIRMRTNLDEWLRLGADHPLRVEEGAHGKRLCVAVRNGLEAVLARPVWYELAALVIGEADQADAIQLWSDGACFDLSTLADTI